MSDAVRFPFQQANPRIGKASSLPFLPITLSIGQSRLSAAGLLDTGAMVNGMPYQMGLDLGAVWEEQTERIKLTGNLSQANARVLTVRATVASFPSVHLRFAWSSSNAAHLILGHLDFFLQFDVFFSRSREFFDIQPRQK